MNFINNFTRKISILNVIWFLKYFIFNIFFMMLVGYLTIDSFANSNSRVGALLICFLLPIFIVTRTLNLSGRQRVFRYGTGLIVYFIISIILHGVGLNMLFNAFYPCLILAVSVLLIGSKNALKGVL